MSGRPVPCLRGYAHNRHESGRSGRGYAHNRHESGRSGRGYAHNRHGVFVAGDAVMIGIRVVGVLAAFLTLPLPVGQLEQ